MQITLYQIDAFANKLFEGNPAAVCPLQSWLPDTLMQQIAAENNLSETAFFVPTDSGFHIRWFTPIAEVDLCGHATLASAYVIFYILGYDNTEVHVCSKTGMLFENNTINFNSRSGLLKVSKKDNSLEMEFPVQTPKSCPTPKTLATAFKHKPIECLKAKDYIVVFNNEDEVLNAQPELIKLSKLDLRGVIITAPAKNYDFVCRFFAPKYGINEDPVTGSAYTQLAPYWAEKLGKNNFSAKQVSQRGGEVGLQLIADRVKISGKVVKYMEAKIEINQ